MVAQVIEEYNKSNPCRAPPAPEEGPGLNLVKSRVYTIPEEVTDEEDVSSTASDPRQCKHKASCCHGQVGIQTHFPPCYLIHSFSFVRVSQILLNFRINFFLKN